MLYTQCGEHRDRFALVRYDRYRQGASAPCLQGISSIRAQIILSDAGTAAGRVLLDLGCGVCDVSLIAGRLVAGRGSVTGIAMDSEALEVATPRAKEERLDHVCFVQPDVGSFEAERQDDAVTGV